MNITGTSTLTGCKDCLNNQFLNNIGLNGSSLGLIDKGGTGSVFTGNQLSQTTTTTGSSMLTIESNVDFVQAISGVTQGNPGIVTYAGTVPYRTGDTAIITAVSGMTQLNNNYYPITVIDPTHFSIGVDTTAFTPYSSGGSVTVASSGGTYANNTFTINGATGGHFTNWQDLGGTVLSIDHNTYSILSGSAANPQFTIGNTHPVTTYNTCAAYKAGYETTAICNP
jgi:hypothetical protein